MHRCLAPVILCIAAALPAIAQTTRPDSQQLSQKCDDAIQRGVKFLLSKQNADGSWGAGRETDREGGHTALITLALISCGESYQSPPMQRAIQFLKTAQPQKAIHATYSVALRACVYAELPEALRNAELRSDLRWLEETLIDRGERRGMYDYNKFGGLGGDFSNSQYGVLGVWYAAQVGLEVPRTYWKKVEDAWRNGQAADGGWGYMPGETQSYASMTVAGAVTLLITNDYLSARESADLNRVVVNKPLDDAMKWLADNFAVDANAGRDTVLGQPRAQDNDMLNMFGQLGRVGGTYVNYMLFGYERVGEASGLTHFGSHKWFDEGADYLIRTQAADGSWTGTIDSEADTAYSLLFLSRGRSPIVMQKLQFGNRWNNRPRDVAAFTYFMRRASERHVNWQIVSADASPAEMREAPLMYAASDREMKLSEQEKSNIKNFIEQGGLLVCVNEGDGNDFAKSVVALAEEIFPAYKFRDLPLDHPVYTMNFSVKTPVDPIRGLSNGVRELIVLYPNDDMSWKWQSTGGGFFPKNTPYASLANLSLYVTDVANARYKGQDAWIDVDAAIKPTKSLAVARVRYDGNWNPEPAGWERLSNVMHNQDRLDLHVEPTDAPTNQRVAHLTATQSVQLSMSEKNSLRTYLDNGGLLLLDAAGGSTEAAGSFDGLLREIYPNVTIAPLPLDHPIYHGKTFGGQEINHVNYRRSADFQPVTIPRLRGASVNGKLIAIVSDEDLSGGLVGYSTTGVNGYTPTSAMELMRNLILWRASIK